MADRCAMTTTDNMVERCAKAAYEKMVGFACPDYLVLQDELLPWENQPQSLREEWRGAIRAAIAAMNAPSDAALSEPDDKA